MSTVLLVGYQDQDNLGIRYLASRLQQDGHRAEIRSFGEDPGPLVAEALRLRPSVVGFSLIFQFMVDQFGAVIAALRAAGIDAHVTVGGHYASFEPAAVLDRIPGLDSVVRFEGEDTLAELVARVEAGRDWRVDGLAYRADGIVETPGRIARTDLDSLPWPDRRDIVYESQRMPTASLLASRGCPWKCSFCSIITFYEANGTRGRRRRGAAGVVDEVEHLVRERGVRLVLFQDDDFLAGGRAATAWALDVAREMTSRDLHRECRFKFSCRSDEVRPDVLGPLVEAGLTHVYLGVEAGDPDDLVALNKLMKPEVHVRAGEVLRSLGLSFDFGFQLLQPWSTLASVRNNVAFLRSFTGDGWTVAGFCRTLPYVGTPLETRLRAEGRLTGAAVDAEYRFLDPRLDVLWDFSLAAFEGRNYGKSATWDVLRSALFEATLTWPDRPRDAGLLREIRSLAAASNAVLLDVVDAALDLVETIDVVTAMHPDLVDLARLARREDAFIRQQLSGVLARRPRQVDQELFR